MDGWRDGGLEGWRDEKGGVKVREGEARKKTLKG